MTGMRRLAFCAFFLVACSSSSPPSSSDAGTDGAAATGACTTSRYPDKYPCGGTCQAGGDVIECVERSDAGRPCGAIVCGGGCACSDASKSICLCEIVPQP
jgi:hypothetical protein